MWVLSWKKDALSKFATFVSIIGALMRYAGVLCLFSVLIPGAIICIGIGIGLHFCAEAIAKGKAKKVVGATNNAPSAVEVPVETNTVPQTETKSEEPKEKKCIRCGAVVKAENNFCSSCGYELK